MGAFSGIGTGEVLSVSCVRADLLFHSMTVLTWRDVGWPRGSGLLVIW